MAERLLLRIPEVADALSMSPRKVHDLVASGEIDSLRIGRSVRVTAAALRRWVSERAGEGAEPVEA